MLHASNRGGLSGSLRSLDLPARRDRGRGMPEAPGPKPGLASDVDTRGPIPCVAGKKGTTVNLGPTELIIILAIVLLLFGGKKLPALARSLGKSSREFKKGVAEGTADEEDSEVRS